VVVVLLAIPLVVMAVLVVVVQVEVQVSIMLLVLEHLVKEIMEALVQVHPVITLVVEEVLVQ
jgi:hypothetical protein